jgi:hypothetical protein
MNLASHSPWCLRFDGCMLGFLSLLQMEAVGTGADKSLAFPISYFPICNNTKRIFLG